MFILPLVLQATTAEFRLPIEPTEGPRPTAGPTEKCGYIEPSDEWCSTPSNKFSQKKQKKGTIKTCSEPHSSSNLDFFIAQHVDSVEKCQQECRELDSCMFWSWDLRSSWYRCVKVVEEDMYNFHEELLRGDPGEISSFISAYKCDPDNGPGNVSEPTEENVFEPTEERRPTPDPNEKCGQIEPSDEWCSTPSNKFSYPNPSTFISHKQEKGIIRTCSAPELANWILVDSVEECQQECREVDSCMFWSWDVSGVNHLVSPCVNIDYEYMNEFHEELLKGLEVPSDGNDETGQFISAYKCDPDDYPVNH